ncbi:hypothetical protein HGH93_17265 [Chitinophaga polysaccharea]|uniref:hypothetical protein n=1 Tax=Chitinophaga TaxID=79328 RepID=UPI0014555EEC|nr:MULTISPECIES: hypothetical protein [Chitinophaga]NLR59862.1 hypothetical protein [Chitinophaga polysaccharea]NLU96391.1 hypothetical protein [Chitinophaga sp. Ak27]
MLSTATILCLLLLPHGHKHPHAGKEADPHYTVIELSFEDVRTPPSCGSDTLFYDPERRLQWDDFLAQPSPAGPSAAVAYTSFAYDGSSNLVHDTLRIVLRLQVFFIKSASWVRPDAKNSYTLAHEQLHFDITRLVVERFKQKLRQTALNRDDYDSIIQYQYLQSFREMNRLQYKFDEETDHGLNPAAQIRWRDKVNIGLKNNGVLPEELGIEGINFTPIE